MGLGMRLLVCIFVLGTTLYLYLNEQNKITQLRLKIPSEAEKCRLINQENTRLQFELDRFENPLHLMELAQKPEYRHLKHPQINEIITITVPKGS